MARFDPKHFVRVLLIVLSITILIGIGIMIYFIMLSNNEDHIQLDITANGKKTIEFEGLALIPGEERRYDVALRSDIPEDYVIALDFVESGDKNSLKQFAYARITVGDKVLCDERLDALFEGDSIKIATYLSKKEGCDMVITYYIPAHVGNEAENASADFKIVVSSVKEK